MGITQHSSGEPQVSTQNSDPTPSAAHDETEGVKRRLPSLTETDSSAELTVQEAKGRLMSALGLYPSASWAIDALESEEFTSVHAFLDAVVHQFLTSEELQVHFRGNRSAVRALLYRAVQFDDVALHELPLNPVVLFDQDKRQVGGHLGKLGEGGFGVVYQTVMEGKRYAAKLMKTWAISSDNRDEMILRFLGEAEAMSRIGKGVPRVIQHGEADGRIPYFLMELVDGSDLARVNTELNALVNDGGRRPDRWILHVVNQAMKTVERAHHPDGDTTSNNTVHASEFLTGTMVANEETVDFHSATPGILHRDIKPSNLMVTPESETVVMDWGLKGVANEQETDGITQAGQLAGSPPYMAPELFSGGLKAASTASDIYAFGCTLFEMLTGRPPFAGSASKIMHGHLSGVPDFSLIRNDDIRKLLQRMLAKNPYQRPESLAECSEVIDSVIGEEELPEYAFALQGADSKDDEENYAATMAQQTIGFAAEDDEFVGVGNGDEYTYILGKDGQYKARRKGVIHHPGVQAVTVSAVLLTAIAAKYGEQAMTAIASAFHNKKPPPVTSFKPEGLDTRTTAAVTPQPQSAPEPEEPKDPEPIVFAELDDTGKPVEPCIELRYMADGTLQYVSFLHPKQRPMRQSINPTYPAATHLHAESGVQAFKGHELHGQAINKVRLNLLPGQVTGSFAKAAQHSLEVQSADGNVNMFVSFVHAPDADLLSFYVIADRNTGQQYIFDNAAEFVRQLEALNALDAFNGGDFASLSGDDVTEEEYTAGQELVDTIATLVEDGQKVGTETVSVTE